MTLHLKKLSVGVQDVDDMVRRQSRFIDEPAYHTTRHRPKDHQKLIDDGSLYWIIKGVMVMRQKIIGFREHIDAIDPNITRWDILLDKAIYLVEPMPHRPFQGWRYLKSDDAPKDIAHYGDDVSDIYEDPALLAQLRDIGVL